MRVFAIYCLALVLASSCAVSTNIPKPNESYAVAEIARPVSNVAIPVSFNKVNLLAEINSRLSGLLYEDMDLSVDNLQVKVWTIQSITMEFVGSTIKYRVPIKVWASGSFDILGFSVTSTMEAEMAMAFTTSFSFSKDGALIPKTSLTGYDWIKEPMATIGMMTIPINFLADKVLESSKDDICSSIDTNLAKGLDLSSVINQITAAARRPILINPDYNVWLVLVPQKVSVSPFTSTDLTVSTTIGFKALSDVVIAKKMPELQQEAPRPELSMGNGADNYLNIRFGLDIPYSEAETLFSKEIVGKTFSKGSRSVRVDSLRIYGSGERVVVGAQLFGSINGWIYFKGLASYNSASRSVEFLNLDYELQTRNILHRSASWLFRSSIINSLKEAMVFPIGAELDKMLAVANRNLVQNRSVRNMEINGRISELSIEQIHLIPEAFRVIVKANGEVAVMVEKLN